MYIFQLCTSHIFRIIRPDIVFDIQDNLYTAKQYKEVNCVRYLDILHALSFRIIRAAIPLSYLYK
jgi:hypothetical protein